MDCSASGDCGHSPGAQADECGHGRCPSPLTPGLTFLEQLPLQPWEPHGLQRDTGQACGARRSPCSRQALSPPVCL